MSRKRLSEVLPRRESSRLRGIAADGSMIHAERQGEVSPCASSGHLLVGMPALGATTGATAGARSEACCTPHRLPAPWPPISLPQITVVAGEVIRRYASGAMSEEQEPQDRHPQGAIE